jgi:uncharacterized protein (TIGR04255 family)
VADAAPKRVVYPYPPVVEVICQVTFAQPVPWSVATPGVLWTAIQDEYPAEPKTQGAVEASFDQEAGELTVNPKGTRYVFSNEEQSRRLLANGTCLSVNGLRPYEEWPSVADRFRRAIQAFSESVGPFKAKSVNLRYINRVVIPETKVDLDDYFNVPIYKSHQEDAVLQSIVARSQSVSPTSSVVTTVTFASTTHPAEDELAFILDIELSLPLTGDAGPDDLIKAVEELHRLENREFESTITPKCRELFNANDR